MDRKRVISICLAALLGGCGPIVSLHPLFTEETTFFEPKLLGTWVDDVNKPKSTWEFARLERADLDALPKSLRNEPDKGYRFNLTDQEGHKVSFVACLVNLENRLFLDILPDRVPSGKRDVENTRLLYNTLFFLPVHTFLKVDSIGEQLVLRMTQDDQFKELLKAEPNALEHVVLEDRLLLTASTKELQAFVVKHAGDERLFPDIMTLVRK